MKKIFKSVIFICTTLIASSCIELKQNKGYITPESDNSTIDFSTNRSIPTIAVKIDGVEKNFLFDTGDDQTTIHRVKLIGKTTTKSTSSGAKVKLGQETVGSIKLGNFEFKDICATNLNMSALVEKVPNFGGLIGQAVISKANWMIDFPKNKMQISKSAISTDGFETIQVKNIRDPKISIIVEGETHTALLDLGASGGLVLPKESAIAKKLIETYKFEDYDRDGYTAAGPINEKAKKAIIPSAKIGNFEIKNVEVLIYTSSQIKIGSGFFKNNILYIDNTNKVFKIK